VTLRGSGAGFNKNIQQKYLLAGNNNNFRKQSVQWVGRRLLRRRA
jgi:hypothetical protein